MNFAEEVALTFVGLAMAGSLSVSTFWLLRGGANAVELVVAVYRCVGAVNVAVATARSLRALRRLELFEKTILNMNADAGGRCARLVHDGRARVFNASAGAFGENSTCRITYFLVEIIAESAASLLPTDNAARSIAKLILTCAAVVKECVLAIEYERAGHAAVGMAGVVEREAMLQIVVSAATAQHRRRFNFWSVNSIGRPRGVNDDDDDDDNIINGETLELRLARKANAKKLVFLAGAPAA